MPAEVNPNNLETGNHSGLSHTGIPGVGLTTRQRLLLPSGGQSCKWLPNPGVSAVSDWLTGSSLFGGPDFTGVTATAVPTAGSDADGAYIQLSNADAATNLYTAGGNFDVLSAHLPRVVCKFKTSYAGVTVNQTGELRVGIGQTGVDFAAATEAIWFAAPFDPSGSITAKLNRIRAGGGLPLTDTLITLADGQAYYFVIEYTSSTEAVCTIYDSSFGVVYTTTISGGANLPVFSAESPLLQFAQAGDAGTKFTNVYHFDYSAAA